MSDERALSVQERLTEIYADPDGGHDAEAIKLVEAKLAGRGSAPAPSVVGGETNRRLRELKQIMATDIAKWDASPELRQEYEKLIDAKLAGRPDDANPSGAAGRPFEVAQIERALGADGWREFSEHSARYLSSPILDAIADEFAEPSEPKSPASRDELALFSSRPEQAALVGEWGDQAPQKLARLQQRIAAIAATLDDDEFDSAVLFIDELKPQEATAVFRALAG